MIGAKRLFDILVSAIGIVGMGPLMIAVAVAIRVDSDGPALFRQQRLGLNGRLFKIHKFRTMYANSSGVGLSKRGDPRVTPVGALLRQSKLDELPQLWDVLRGKMSLVGPRPELPHYAKYWSAEDKAIILSVAPGITDPASIRFMDEASILAAADDPENAYVKYILPVKARIYCEYVEARSIGGDLRIIADTVRAVLTQARLNTSS